MFSILADNNIIWTPTEEDKRLLSPSVNLEVNKVGSASFKVLPGHAYYDNLVKMKTIITIYQDSRIIFKGRVFSDAMDFYKIKTVKVEGILGYFNDTIVRAYEFNGSPEEYFTFLINQHNSQVEEYQRFKVGRVTVVDDNDYITRSSTESPTTWSEITKKLVGTLGGYICIRYEDDGNYIDYLADYEDTSTQSIAFSVNLLDLNQEANGNNVATCIIPYGAEDEETSVKVDITSVNDGKDWIEDVEAVAKYGRIYEVVTWDNVTVPSNLKAKAEKYLSTKVKITNRIKIKAVDLHLADETIEAFSLGDYVEVISDPHNINDRVLLTAFIIPLDNPANCIFTLGLEKESYVNSNNVTSINRVDIVKKELGDTISRQDNIVLNTSQTNINTAIETSEEATRTLLKEYISSTEFSEYKQTLEYQQILTANGVEERFRTVNDRITTENGETKREVEDINKYIRRENGAIILGEVGSNLTTKIANGRISFLYNDNLEVAYISDNQLYITEAQILKRIVIGNFAFIPRENGNLSFKKIL